MSNPLIGFQVDPADLKFVGEGLERPECILAERDGTLWSADGRGGVMRIAPDGTQELILQGKPNKAADFQSRLCQLGDRAFGTHVPRWVKDRSAYRPD